jgi:hypothetical protein
MAAPVGSQEKRRSGDDTGEEEARSRYRTKPNALLFSYPPAVFFS